MPAWDFVEVWVNQDREASTETLRLKGVVTRVTGESSFYLQDAAGTLWNCGFVGLVGVMPSHRVATAPEILFARQSWTNLNASLKGRQVELVTRSFTPQHTALGVVWVGGTNVNLALLEQGRLSVKKDRIRAETVPDQYAFIAAERRARRAGAGRWSGDIPAPRGANAD